MKQEKKIIWNFTLWTQDTFPWALTLWSAVLLLVTPCTKAHGLGGAPKASGSPCPGWRVPWLPLCAWSLRNSAGPLAKGWAVTILHRERER